MFLKTEKSNTHMSSTMQTHLKLKACTNSQSILQVPLLCSKELNVKICDVLEDVYNGLQEVIDIGANTFTAWTQKWTIKMRNNNNINRLTAAKRRKTNDNKQNKSQETHIYQLFEP